MNVEEEIKKIKHNFEIHYEKKPFRIDNLMIKYNKNDNVYYIYRILLNDRSLMYNIKLNIYNHDINDINDKIKKIQLNNDSGKICLLKLDEKKFDIDNLFINGACESWIDIIFDCDLSFLNNNIVYVLIDYNYIWMPRFYDNIRDFYDNIRDSSAYVYQIDNEYIENHNIYFYDVDDHYFGHNIKDNLKMILLRDSNCEQSFYLGNSRLKYIIQDLYEGPIDNICIYAYDSNLNIESKFSCMLVIQYESSDDRGRPIFEKKYEDVYNIIFDKQEMKNIINNNEDQNDEENIYRLRINIYPKSKVETLGLNINYNVDNDFN